MNRKIEFWVCGVDGSAAAISVPNKVVRNVKYPPSLVCPRFLRVAITLVIFTFYIESGLEQKNDCNGENVVINAYINYV